jgi:hypothetical protein
MKVSAYKVKQELPPLILTIGHSRRSINEFIHLLAAHQVQITSGVRPRRDALTPWATVHG